jgi:peptide deformylase
MMKIVKLGHPVLRAKAEPVGKIDESLRGLADEMLWTMNAYDGCGLAGNQIGVAKRIIVIDVSEVKKRPSVLRIGGKSQPVRKHMPMVLINPEFEPLPGKNETGPEGCLSIPGIYADVERHGAVRVRALDLRGEPVEFEAEGLLSRALQHEVDHLDGLLFIDRLDAEERKRVADELQDLSGGMVG